MPNKSITKNYLYNLTYQILILILPLITTPYLSRVLGAEGTGIYSYTYTIVNYFVLFGSLGVALYGQREIAYAQQKKQKRKKIFIELVIFRFITISIAFAIYFYYFMRTGKRNSPKKNQKTRVKRKKIRKPKNRQKMMIPKKRLKN